MEIITNPGTIILLLIIITGGLVFYYLKLQYLQEMARIEHGLTSQPKDKNRLKKLGIIFVSIGASILAGYLVGRHTGIHPLVIIPTMIFTIGGAALLLINEMK